ncbi:hypothetical protein, partial [Zoogloea sp.]|uniref:hypothetical protein n=1 Tax=Zoogloea sp. TaxID=49181 RepID=UPI002C15950B
MGFNRSVTGHELRGDLLQRRLVASSLTRRLSQLIPEFELQQMRQTALFGIFRLGVSDPGGHQDPQQIRPAGLMQRGHSGLFLPFGRKSARFRFGRLVGLARRVLYGMLEIPIGRQAGEPCAL